MAAGDQCVGRLDVLPRAELVQLASRIGSDVAFFASGAALALAWGRGERLHQLDPLPSMPALVAVPPIGVPTPEAYGWWDEMHATPGLRGALVLDAPAFATWGSVGRLGGNDFELPVFGRHPALRALFERVAATHPYWVRMCGSGSAVAAVYANERVRDDAAMQLGTQHQQVMKTSTRALVAPGPEPHSQ